MSLKFRRGSEWKSAHAAHLALVDHPGVEGDYLLSRAWFRLGADGEPDGTTAHWAGTRIGRVALGWLQVYSPPEKGLEDPSTVTQYHYAATAASGLIAIHNSIEPASSTNWPVDSLQGIESWREQLFGQIHTSQTPSTEDIVRLSAELQRGAAVEQ